MIIVNQIKENVMEITQEEIQEDHRTKMES